MRDVFVPRIGHRKDLHGGDNGVRLRRVEQCRRGYNRRGPENSSFLIDPFRLRGGRDNETKDQRDRRVTDSPSAVDRATFLNWACFSFVHLTSDL